MNKKLPVSIILGALLFIHSCAILPNNKHLDPESKDFISKTRYIITKEEKATFMSLPPEKRAQFIEDFWARRDPTPGTEINEFKDQYYQRIEEANRIFREGSTPGWLQDRGRIYIMFGRPSERITYPRGMGLYGKPTEIWYYGFFPIVFIDENWTGNYLLSPLSAYQISEIAKAHSQLTSIEEEQSAKQPPVNFNLSFSSKNEEVEFKIEIPFNSIWFKSRDEKFVTTLEIRLEVVDKKGKKVWDYKESLPLSYSKEEGLKLIDEIYTLKIKAELKPGEYTVEAEVSNQTGGGASKKTLKFKV